MRIKAEVPNVSFGDLSKRIDRHKILGMRTNTAALAFDLTNGSGKVRQLLDPNLLEKSSGELRRITTPVGRFLETGFDLPRVFQDLSFGQQFSEQLRGLYFLVNDVAASKDLVNRAQDLISQDLNAQSLEELQSLRLSVQQCMKEVEANVYIEDGTQELARFLAEINNQEQILISHAEELQERPGLISAHLNNIGDFTAMADEEIKANLEDLYYYFDWQYVEEQGFGQTIDSLIQCGQ